MSHFFIIDTNVVVAGLLTAHADSPVARILDGMLGAAFPFVVSEALLAEYRAVLVRPRLCKLHGLSSAEVDAILTDLARHAIVLAPISTAATPSLRIRAISFFGICSPPGQIWCWSPATNCCCKLRPCSSG
ncbi:PIN domain-containing protein [Polaromonas sp. P1(28)-13]|nr:PIN domain-containing protein [Polaromonas sp. P1(28)-13]